jgi:hypothetical protein
MRLFHPSIKRLLVAINRSRFLAAAEGAAIGAVIGLIDIHSTNEDGFNTSLAVLAAAVAIGLRHGGRSWQAWSPLGWCFYLMHRAAIARGYRPPYVEEDANRAILSLYVLWPTGLGLALGAFIRFPISRLLRSVGWTKAETDRPMDPGRALSRRPDLAVAERRPRQRLTVGGWMIVIALFGLHLAALRALLIHEPFLGLGTIYSERYSEARFTTLRVGMSRGEVEAIMGRPLRVVPWNQEMGPHDEEMWCYSDQPNALANFHRRWVLFEKGKVAVVINDFWID